MWFLPWLLAAVVGIGALWIGIDAALGGDSESPADQPPERPAAVADPSPSNGSTPEAAPELDESPSDGGEPEDEEEPEEKEKKKGLISKGVPIQILNGTSLPDADDRVAADLEKLGFDIVAMNPWLATPATVVYWSTPNDQKAATLLAERFGWSAQPRPEELSTEVRLHVVVGADSTVD